MNVEQLEACKIGDQVLDSNLVVWEKVDFGSDDEWESNADNPYRRFATSEALWNAYEPIQRIVP